MGEKVKYASRSRGILPLGSIRMLKLGLIACSLLISVVLLSKALPMSSSSNKSKTNNEQEEEIIGAKTKVECDKVGRCYSNPLVLLGGCSVTILFLEPRISKAPPKSDVWYALESMAANVMPLESTCVLIQTSFNCPYISEEDLFSRIRSNAMPMFRSLVDSGNVRIASIESDNFYAVEHCHWNVNRLFMHPLYWSREFMSQDSDSVLVLQSDSVFCRTFNSSQWTDLAYVGGVWPPKANTHGNPAPPEGVCAAMRDYWGYWHGKIWPFPQLKPSPFPDVCSYGRAPVGNGGFSLRSRKWMIKAINTCPSPYTAISSMSTTTTSCNLPNVDYPEDLYFATVLNGINAPMPNAIEAALFAVEMIFLETAMQYYPTNNNMKDDIIKQRLIKQDYDLYRSAVVNDSTITAPIGMHKPWWYHESSLLLSDQMKQQCPFMEHIIPSTLKNLKIKNELLF